MDNKQDLREFVSFLKSSVEAPAACAQPLRSQLKKELNPSLSRTLGKSFVLHAAGSLVTLALCPQFGVSVTGSHGLMPYLMAIHPALCFFACGVLWMVIGEILSLVFLSFDEQRVLGSTRWGLSFSLILLSLLGFACFGHVQIDTWLVVWLLGALSVAFGLNLRLLFQFRRISANARIVLK